MSGPHPTDSPVTWVEPGQWGSRAVVLRSDGSPRALLDVIAQAVEAVEYPITERSYTDLTLVFESRGVSLKSWSGDVTTVIISPTAEGSKATFTSKGKPSGLARIQMKSNATTWTGRIVPGFGSLWRDPKSMVGSAINPYGSTEVLTPKGRRRARKISAAQDQERQREDAASLEQTPTPFVPPPSPMASTAPPPPGTPAGWLADPVSRYEHRYWDGGKWTEHVSTGGVQSTDFL